MNAARPVSTVSLCWALAAWPHVAAAPAAVPQAVLEAEAERVAAIARASQSAVAIFAGAAGGGSGVIISPDGYALSNFHVTKPAGNAMKCGLPDGRLYDAVIVGLDPVGDVALIKLLGRDDFPAAELADSDGVQVGDWCFAIGNPFLLATDFLPTVTYGVVSGVHRYQYPAGTLLEYADCIQVDAAINPGNSGGPLFNAAGQLIGINGRGSFEKRGRVNVGVGYAITINQIKNFLGCLKAGRIVDHATLGAIAGVDNEGAVVVTDILEDCDAFRRGLRYDDEIVSFDQRPIGAPNAFKNALGVLPRDWRVPLVFRREGRKYTTVVRLLGVHNPAELLAKMDGRDIVPEAPDKKPAPEKPGEPAPEPKPALPLPTAAPMPEIAKRHFEERAGYANYYFNRLNQDRVWQAFAARGDFSGTGDWTLQGKTRDGGDVQIALGQAASRIELPIGDFEVQEGDSLAATPNPPGSGGLLAALHLWRKLLVAGPGKFGQVSYWGAAPLLGHAGLMDVLLGVDAGVECRFIFDPAAGDLLALELFTDENADPCEVFFFDYRDSDGRRIPQRLLVRHGDGVFEQFRLSTFQLGGAAD